MSLEFGFQKHTDKNGFVVNDATTWGEEFPREGLMLFLISERYNKTSYSVVENKPNFSHDLASSWLIKADLDGSYFIVLVAAPEWENIPYQKNDLVYDEGKLFKAIKATEAGIVTSDEEHWYEVTKSSELPILQGSSNAYIKTGYYLHDAHALICLGEKSIAYAGEKCGCSDECETIKDWAWSMMFYNAAVFSQGFGEYEEAGKFMDNVNARCGSDSSKTPCNCN